ncbi:hypothetical protein J1N35_005013 [Gossypium stocksii]|uniref:Uncharacterized protein n=1 Tax=Gossypium stocksii TaxID=47602 RepID=A0A9D3WER4_9ROSI|nr:hypothetical protein J1N35_005013 [Gossypium stocksii]
MHLIGLVKILLLAKYNGSNEGRRINSSAITLIWIELFQERKNKDQQEFRRISRYASTKEAWNILKIAHERTSRVKMSKLQMFTTKFETICMSESE